MTAGGCCCGAGAAVSGEVPEFGCADCPRHLGENCAAGERCRRHAKTARPPLTDATRERLIGLIEPHVGDNWGTAACHAADAILAEFRPVATTRERLAEAVGVAYAKMSEHVDPSDARTWNERFADHFLASGAVEDRAEVERKTREQIADEVTRWGAGRHLVEDVVVGIAASIREGRS